MKSEFGFDGDGLTTQPLEDELSEMVNQGACLTDVEYERLKARVREAQRVGYFHCEWCAEMLYALRPTKAVE